MRLLAWALCAMIGAAAMFGGATTMLTAVADRTRELAALRAIGFPGRALAGSLLTEAAILAAAGGLLGLALAKLALGGGAVRIAMSAFALQVDAIPILAGGAGAVLLGLLGTLPAIVRLLRMPIAQALKER
jgi:putative ABC transport system permease protein